MASMLETYELVEKVRESSRNTLLKVRHRRDKRLCILKLLSSDKPGLEERQRFRHEYDILESLAGTPGVVGPQAFIESPEGDCMVLDWFPGGTLGAAFQDRLWEPEAFVRLAMGIAEILGRIHAKRIVHKDISPSNILYDPQSGELAFIDFGLSSRISRERTGGFGAVFEGTPHYLSPEQTGRANRSVDYRSDYYAFGMLLYYLACGVHAFETTDLVELVHCHLAKLPVPPAERGPGRIRGGVGPELSELIMHLTAKAPEDRYQSMAGLMADLQDCLAIAQGKPRGLPFRAGAQDHLDQFSLPQASYGREAESQALRASFDRVAGGEQRTVFVEGYAGIGKTTLVQGLYEALTASRSFLLRGKFDQLRRNRPYEAIGMALRELCRQILGLGAERQATIRKRLAESLQANGALLSELVPEFAALVGPLPPPPALSPRESENRWLLTLGTLFQAVAGRRHPVLLHLDDLQWCDPASAKLLEHLCFHAAIPYLMVVFSYRDNEILETTPFRSFLERGRAAPACSAIQLKPLDEASINRLAAAALHSDESATRELGRLIHVRAKGNPFFAVQLLEHCHAEGLIAFDAGLRRWKWDLDAIAALGYAEDVVTLLVYSIQKLPAATVDCLGRAACLGARFRYSDLALVAAEPERLGAELLALLEAEYLVPEDGDYVLLDQPGILGQAGGADPVFRFQHDRIQQAAYQLLGEELQRRLHLQIARGRLAAGRTQADELVDLVDHYQRALPLLSDPAERLALARLNHQAAAHVRAASMFDLAFRLLEQARGLLGDAAGEGAFRARLLAEYAEAAFVVHRVDAAEAACAELLSGLDAACDRARVLRIQADYYNFLGRLKDSLAKSLEALRLVGVELPLEPGPEALYARIVAVGESLAGRSLDAVYELPEIQDERVRLALGLLAGIIVPAFMSGNQNLFALASLAAISLSLEHGNSAESAIAFSNYAILLSGMGQYQAAFAFSKLAIRLNQRFDDPQWRAFIHSSHTLFCMPWNRPWREFVAQSRQTIDYGFQTGDLFIMSYQCTYVVPWDESLNLAQAIKAQEHWLSVIKQAGQDGAWACGKFAVQKWRGLAGLLPQRDAYDEPGFATAEFLASLERQQNYSALAIHQLYHMETQWFFGGTEAALAACHAADALAAARAGSAYQAEQCLFSFLVHIDALASAPEPDQAGLRERLALEAGRMAAWAKSCPANFGALDRLMQAELARAEGRVNDAAAAFRACFEALADSANLCHQALAHERGAAFLSAQGDHKMAAYLLDEAWQLYGRWGAHAKQAQLEECHPAQLFVRRGDPAGRPLSMTLSSSAIDIDGLVNVSSLIKASQAISREIEPEALLGVVMPIVAENAGAQHVWLVLREDGEWRVAAHLADGKPSPGEVGLGLSASAIPQPVQERMRGLAEDFICANAQQDPSLAADSQVKRRAVRSAMGTALESRGQLLGYWYLENNLLAGAFNQQRREILGVLSTQVAISLENARMYRSLGALNRSLEQRVLERTEELTEKNRLIMSGIEYAGLLQRAILPPASLLERHLPERLVIWRPRDLVGGDLYWFSPLADGFLAAVVDCTGHGVPGAFMAMAAHTHLNQLVLDADPSDPAGLLARLHGLTRHALGQDRPGGESNDGLDIGLCSWVASSDSLYFAGARIDLIVAGLDGVKVVKADRLSLGYPGSAVEEGLRTHCLSPARGAAYYLASDGLSSQLGGPKHLPFGKARLAGFIADQATLDMEGQSLALERELREWQAGHEQIDDITVFGFKL